MKVKSKLPAIIYTVVFLVLTLCMLTRSRLSLQYACLGLLLWYNAMIPTLLPFMILSGIMIRMGLTEKFSAVLYPVIKPVYHVSKNVCYAMIMGFLCGFPMGAKTVADLYEREMITEEEAKFLLAFCNNIGPIYFVSFVLPLLERKLVFPYLFGMYGLPLIYGWALRYTIFRKRLGYHNTAYHSAQYRVSQYNLMAAVDDSIQSGVQSILSLGGYMILFNLLNILPHILLHKNAFLLAPLLEISGGLRLLGKNFPLYSLLMLPFGGFSCIAQTYSCIKKTRLSVGDYTFHKLFLTLLTGIYYLLWRLMFPASFLS
ncbi:MAG: 2-amino-4-hydroxy-6-hydroxymethyldihydropteridine diphosphokinase [Clostridium sp.]|nr:2-amino-4-hydroxy-6-hydroxymethyldihydropteridine diphosphokinase [Clostridium sp.]